MYRKKLEEHDETYIFKDQIEFITKQVIGGQNITEEEIKKAKEKAEEYKLLSLQETRKKLPIYPYREGILEAMHDYQILIIVGETGSGKD